MELTAEQFVDNLLSGEADNEPSDKVKIDDLDTEIKLPKWFDANKYNQTWKSLHAVRTRHIKTNRATKLKNIGVISQRDLSLVLFAALGYISLKPDKFGVRQLREGDWEPINHFWRVIGYMLGLQDRYNVYQPTFQESRQVFNIIIDRVYSPCLENVPEYFEHMNHVSVEGLGYVIIGLEKTSISYLVKYFANVPGYIYTEKERMKFQEKLKIYSEENKEDTGVETTALMHHCGVKDLPDRPPRLLYFKDYDTLETSPAYKNLPSLGKYKLAFTQFLLAFHSTNIGRIILNHYFKLMLFFAKYLPVHAIWKLGVKKAYTDMFEDGAKDDAAPKLNSEYAKPSTAE